MQSKTPFEQFRKCLNHPELMVEFQNRVRELQDLFLNEDQLWQLIDEFAAMVGSPVGDSGKSVQITEAMRKIGQVTITTAEPHGFDVGAMAFVSGVKPFLYNGAKEILDVPAPNQFVYAANIFAPEIEPLTSQSLVTSEPAGGGWWEIDRARWDRHPRSRAVEGPSLRTGSFYFS